MAKAKVDDRLSVPPSEAVLWRVTCVEKTRSSREATGEVARYADVKVVARTWFDARQAAFQRFALEHHIYEPEGIGGVIAGPAPKDEGIAPPQVRDGGATRPSSTPKKKRRKPSPGPSGPPMLLAGMAPERSKER
jgi:hypothetical protein